MNYPLHRDRRSSHRTIARLVAVLGVSPILDVGAAEGSLARLLRGRSLTIDAVEPDPDWAAAAAPLYRRVYAEAVETAALPARTYRAVVCADVLEHTADPVGVLRQLREAATRDARFVISVPNVAHAAARALLLIGQFPQAERGIFDRTHLHFYTRSTALEMIRAAGLEPVAVETTPVPLEHLWPHALGGTLLEAAMRLQELAIRLAPRLFSFQWIVVAEAREPGRPRA
ncbi:MAG: class I SAM-dependent methyltransferase [Chloroflexota bacterium]|nr:class I SAM-dependent methyltransferase [Chloroflexota bacterium]